MSDQIRSQAEQIAKFFFTNGAGERATRLALIAGGLDLGGWSEGAFTDRLCDLLTALAARDPRPQVEELQRRIAQARVALDGNACQQKMESLKTLAMSRARDIVKLEAREDALEAELAACQQERDTLAARADWIEPLKHSEDPEEAEAVRITPSYVLMTRRAADQEAEIHRQRRDALAARDPRHYFEAGWQMANDSIHDGEQTDTWVNAWAHFKPQAGDPRLPEGLCTKCSATQYCAEHEPGPPSIHKRNYSIGHGLTYLECPCCGDNGAVSDGEGCFYDGQELICGCPGLVSVDADGDDDPWINNGDEPCAKCAPLPVQKPGETEQQR